MTLVNFGSVKQGLFFDYRCPKCKKNLAGSIDNDLAGDFLGVQQCDNCRVVWIWILSKDKFNCTIKGY